METLTKAHNVDVIDECFNIPQLDRTRRIWLYRPPDYYHTEKEYTVIYMHDGQNLFDEATAFGEEWGVDKTLNQMWADCLIIGIDNCEHRMKEYNYRDHEEYGEGEGRKYLEFIVQTLKPFIDKNFRTKKSREHTHIAGSSMGGLISLYGAMHHADTFGGAGVFSPSLWITPNVIDDLKPLAEKHKHLPQRYYFYGGEKEGENMVEYIDGVTSFLRQYPQYKVHVAINPEGDHSEFHWRNKFPEYYFWLTQQL